MSKEEPKQKSHTILGTIRFFGLLASAVAIAYIVTN